MARLRQRVVERYRRLPPLQQLPIEPEPARPRRRARVAVKKRHVVRSAPTSRARTRSTHVTPPAAPPVRPPTARKKHPNRITHDFLFQRRK
jgi:hypothetical protein